MNVKLYHPQGADLNVYLVASADAPGSTIIGRFIRKNGRGSWTFHAVRSDDWRDGRKVAGWLTDESATAALA